MSGRPRTLVTPSEGEMTATAHRNVFFFLMKDGSFVSLTRCGLCDWNHDSHSQSHSSDTAGL